MRYEITKEFREGIKNSSLSLTKMSKFLGFNVKNIYYINRSISEDQLNAISLLINKKIHLGEINFDYVKNLGTYSFSHPFTQPKESPDFAEFIGIMLGDGYLGKNEINISLDKRNINYINYVQKIFNKIFSVEMRKKTHKTKNSGYLYFYSAKIVAQLIKFGLKVGNKLKSQVGIPKWIKENKEYSEMCIKGLIDTDGCIYFCKRDKQRYISFTNYDTALYNDFNEVTNHLGYHFVKSNKHNTRLYRKDEVARFINEVKPFKAMGL